MKTSVQFEVQVPASEPDEVAQYILEVLAELEDSSVLDVDVSLGGASAEPDDVESLTVAEQLARLGDSKPSRRSLLLAVHNGLLELGYEPHVPSARSDYTGRPASYLRYTDPSSDTPLGYVNSLGIILAGKNVKQRLRDEAAATPTRDGARIYFDDDKKVRLILSLAREFKSSDRS